MKRSIFLRADEKDEFLNRHMTLLVCDIIQVEGPNMTVIELSDGWRMIYAIVQNQRLGSNSNPFNQSNECLITDLLESRKIFSGQKLRVINLKKHRLNSAEKILNQINFKSQKLRDSRGSLYPLFNKTTQVIKTIRRVRFID